MSGRFYPLRISKIVRETDDSRSVYFEIPSELKEIFQFIPGQYLNIRIFKNDHEYRRAYSICSSIHETDLGITVKRVKSGIVSNYINDGLSVGDDVEIMPPEGKFTIDTSPDKMRDHYFFAAGSGITPVISMIKSVLEIEPKSTIYLLYGNRDVPSIIFKKELDLLLQKYEAQFHLIHTLTQGAKKPGIAGLFKKSKVQWDGWTGRINKEKVTRFLDNYPGLNKDKVYYACGPGDMIDTVQKGLLDKGVDASDIRKEYFSSPLEDGDGDGDKSSKLSSKSNEASVTVHLDGNQIELQIPPKTSILEALIQNNYDPPYSCTSGACSTCLAKVLKGKVAMDVCYALDDDEVEDGYILTCQSFPVTDEIEIKYEN